MEAFDEKFCDSWSHQIPMIEDYPYAGIEFSKDSDMVVPPRAVQGELDKFLIFIAFDFYFLYIYHFYFYCVPEYLTMICLLFADVGPVHLTDFARTR